MEDSFEKHLALVEKVLSTLINYGIKIKPQKCHWFKDQVEFLGHTVSRTGISKPKAYLEKINNFPRPSNVRQLREFLGLVNFQRKFVPECSITQKPLAELTGGKGNKKVTWTPEMEHAFEKLKQDMSKEIELAFPCYSEGAQPLELWVDASATGAGSTLTQIQENKTKIITFASISFNRTQRNYSTLERELAALRWGVKAFRAFLYGTHFILRTDHQPLVYLYNMRLVDSRLARTLEDLSDFDFTICYVPGNTNNAADALSRLTAKVPDPIPEQVITEIPTGLVLLNRIRGGGDSLIDSLLNILEALEQKNATLTILIFINFE